EGLDAERAPKPWRVDRRLDERRKTDLAGRRVRGGRDRDPGGARGEDLVSFVLGRPKHLPRGERTRQRQLVGVPREQLEVVVVRRERDSAVERAEELDVGVPVTRRREARLRVPRAEAKRTGAVVHRDDADARAAEGPDRGEP